MIRIKHIQTAVLCVAGILMAGTLSAGPELSEEKLGAIGQMMIDHLAKGNVRCSGPVRVLSRIEHSDKAYYELLITNCDPSTWMCSRTGCPLDRFEGHVTCASLNCLFKIWSDGRQWHTMSLR